MDIEIGSEIITTKLMIGYKEGIILKVKSIDLKEGSINAEWKNGMCIRLLFENRGKTWELKNDNIIKKDSSDLVYLDEDGYHQMLHAALEVNDKNWFKEIIKELKNFKKYELEELQNGYQQCGFKW